MDQQYQTPFNFSSDVPTSGNEIPFDFQKDSVVTTVPPQEGAARQRAEKWNYGLGPQSPGSEVFLNRIQTGNESEEAQIQANAASYQELAMRKSIIDELLKTKGPANVTPAEIYHISNLSGQPLKDAADFFEAKYAEKVVNTSADAFLKGAIPTEPDFQNMDYAQRVIHLKEGVQKITENLEAQYKAQGLGSKIYDNAERFVPLIYNARMRDSFWALTGSDRQKQYSELLLMENPSEALAIIKNKATEIAEGSPFTPGNPLAALEWLHGLASYSSSEAALDNIFGIVGTGLAVGGAVQGVRSLTTGLRGVVKATGNRTTNPIDILEATGDIDKASQILAERTLAQKTEVFTPTAVERPVNPRMNSIDDLRGQTTTLQTGPLALDGNTHALSREASQRIINTIEANKLAFEKQLADGPVKIARLDPGSNALRVAEVEADRVTNAKNPYIADHIIDIRTSNLDDAITSNRYRLYVIGEKSGPPETRLAIETGSKVGVKAEATPLKAANQNAPAFLPKAEQREFRKLDGLLTIAERMGKKEAADGIAARMEAMIQKYAGETKIPGAGPVNTKVRQFVPLNDNTHRVSIDIGAPGPRPFRTEEGARTAADNFFKFTQGTYSIRPLGGGHVITIAQPIDETLPSVRNALRIETQNQNPKGILSTFRSFLPFGRDVKLSKELMDDSKIAGYGIKNQQKFIRSLLEPVNDLRKGASGKKAWEEFNTFLDRQRMYRNKDNEYGRFSRDFQEFEADWHKEFNRLPTEAEHAAYWSYVQLSDTDWVLRNLNIYRDKARQGRELFQFPVTGAFQNSPHVEGKLIKSFPWDSNAEANFLLWNKDPSQIKKLSNRKFKNMRKEIEEGIKSGELKVVQLAEYGEDHLRATLGIGDLPGGKINYVITNDLKSGPLPFQQIPYRPGGHYAYEYEWYIRQPNLKTTGQVKKTTWYSGDTNFAGVHTERDGNNLIKHLNTARELLIEARATKDTARLEAYLNKYLPTIDLRQWDTSFKGVKGGGTLDPKTPFYLTKNGINVDRTHDLSGIFKRENPNHEFKRTFESPHNLNDGQINLSFAQERGDPLFAFENVGSKTQPIYNFQRAKMMDPMAIAQRAAENVANSRLLDDLKIKAAERYIAEFSDVLAWDVTRIRSNPLDALMNAPVKPESRMAERAAAWDARRSTLELLGIRNQNQIYLDGLQQRAYEWLVSTKFGKKAEELVPEWMFSTIKDPTKALRQVAFHFKQGMGNVASFVNQAHIIFHIGGIEGPTNTIKGGISGQYMSMLRFWEDNPAVIAKFAESQTLTGMQKEHFIEAFEGLKRSGFHKVGREVADYADWMSAKLWEGKLGTFADYATFFYKRGEELGRYTAYATSYNRWRAANPNAVFDSVAQAQVLSRADMLNLNMSGMSNSVLQRGIPGIVTQFFTAHLRQTEQIYSSIGSIVKGQTPVLTPREIAQLIATNSLIYGLPVGLSTVMPLWPIRQSVNEFNMQKSWRPEDAFMTDVLMNGLIAAGAERLGASKYDVGGQGLSGIQLGRDLWRGDKHPVELLSGVSGRVFSGLLKSSYPLSQKVLDLGNYSLTRQDFADILDNISSFSNAEKIIAGVALGKYFGKNGVREEDITTVQALMMGLTGLQLQSIDDAYDQLGSIKDIQNAQKAFERRYGLYVRRAFEAHDKGDLEGFNLYMDRANAQFILGNFPESKRMTMAKRTTDDHAPLVERVYKKFMEIVNTPEAFEDYKKRLEKRGK
jgi:hypothetical protein